MQTKLLLTKNWALNALMLVMMFAFGSVMTANAEGSGTKEDPWIFESGQTYNVDAYKSFYGVFTAPSAGTFSLGQTNYAVYTDATFTTMDNSINPKFNGDYQNMAYTFECEAGRTYYVGNNWVANSIDMLFKFLTEAEPLELKDIDPADGSLFNAGSGIVNLQFNQNVSVGAVELTAGSATETVSANVRGAYVNVDIKDLINQYYKDGRLKAGDDIKLKFNNVAPTADLKKLYNGTGVIEVTYKAGKMPLQIISSSNTPDGDPAMTVFKSYYMSDDNSGIVALTFNGDVNLTEENRPTVRLTYGNMESEDPNEAYSETIIPTALMSNMLIVNLKNKLRRAKDMVASGENYKTMTLSIYNVKDMDGNYAYGNGSGNLGSFFYQYTFEDVVYTPMSDWTTEGGATGVIDNDTKNIALWLSEAGSKATFSGVEIKYVSGGVETVRNISLSELTITPDEDDENARIILIPVPNVSIDANTDVTVTLTGVERPDGLTPAVEAKAFDDFTKTFTTTGRTAAAFSIESMIWHSEDGDVNMIDGTIATLTRGTTSTLKTNKDSEIGYAEYEIRGIADPDNEFVKSNYLMGPQEDGFTITWHDEAFEDGKDYKFTLKAWRSEAEKRGAEPTVGAAEFIIHGAKKAYVYSDVVMVTDISEKIAIASKEDNLHTVEFSAPVTMTAVVNTGSGTSMDCEVTPNDDRTVWTVAIPQYVIDNFNEFSVNVFAKDDEGRALNKTQNGLGTILGYEDGVWFQIDFVSEFNKPEVTISPADGTTLESISTITFTYGENGAISANWNNYEKIKVYNRTTRELIAEFSEDDVVYQEDPKDQWGPYIGATITFAQPVTTPGVYNIEVPADFFVLGEQFDGGYSKAASVTYEVKAPAKPLVVELTPAVGTVTEIPAKIIVTLPNNSSVGKTDTAEPTLVDDKGNSYAATLEIDWDIEDLNVITIVLSGGAIKANGTYTLTIPAGALTYDDDPDNVNATDLVFVYVIGTDGINSLVSAEGGKVSVYSINGTQLLKNADAEAVGKLAKGMYIINGKKVIIR